VTRARCSDDPGDRGSVLVLTLAYALLAIAVILVCVNATSLHLTQKRLDALADAAALAGADGFDLVLENGTPVARLDDAGVRAQAEAVVAAAPESAAVLVSAGTVDGVSARVTVRTSWHPVIVALLVPGGVTLEATATSRNALH